MLFREEGPVANARRLACKVEKCGLADMRYNGREAFAGIGCHDIESKQELDRSDGMLFRAFAVFCHRIFGGLN